MEEVKDTSLYFKTSMKDISILGLREVVEEALRKDGITIVKHLGYYGSHNLRNIEGITYKNSVAIRKAAEEKAGLIIPTMRLPHPKENVSAHKIDYCWDTAGRRLAMAYAYESIRGRDVHAIFLSIENELVKNVLKGGFNRGLKYAHDAIEKDKYYINSDYLRAWNGLDVFCHECKTPCYEELKQPYEKVIEHNPFNVKSVGIIRYKFNLPESLVEHLNRSS